MNVDGDRYVIYGYLLYIRHHDAFRQRYMMPLPAPCRRAAAILRLLAIDMYCCHFSAIATLLFL